MKCNLSCTALFCGCHFSSTLMWNGVVKKYKNSVSSAIFMPYIHQQILPLSLKPRLLTIYVTLSSTKSNWANEILFNVLFIFSPSLLYWTTAVIGPSFWIFFFFAVTIALQLFCSNMQMCTKLKLNMDAEKCAYNKNSWPLQKYINLRRCIWPNWCYFQGEICQQCRTHTVGIFYLTANDEDASSKDSDGDTNNILWSS